MTTPPDGWDRPESTDTCFAKAHMIFIGMSKKPLTMLLSYLDLH